MLVRKAPRPRRQARLFVERARPGCGGAGAAGLPPAASEVLRRLAADPRTVSRVAALHDLYSRRIHACRQRGAAELRALLLAGGAGLALWEARPDASLASLLAAYPRLVRER